ncbi:MAG: aminoacyl-tRNA hydrolase [Candidatus Cloacimonetes bacterium HGW-Cloacimonetes-1]|jgi:PTH1 family peptidyl-tRNA hydrolase|nr:MAG: aminoacyl-tRNA hydrolase [Candidatus Cloacimonetes bacterium HGW-Cloacimonetes-1]
MKLVIGLGNVGPTYQNTRHNIGFKFLDYYASSKKCKFSKDRYFEYFSYANTAFIKPTTFMNCSGLALEAALTKWKIEDTLIIYDDLELAPASFRIRSGGGDGGHNGLKSLFTKCDPNEIKRIRIGIGRNITSKSEVYVLEEIPEDLITAFDDTFRLVTKFIDTYLHSSYKNMLDDYSKWKRAYSGKNDAGIISPKEETDD